MSSVTPPLPTIADMLSAKQKKSVQSYKQFSSTKKVLQPVPTVYTNTSPTNSGFAHACQLAALKHEPEHMKFKMPAMSKVFTSEMHS